MAQDSASVEADLGALYRDVPLRICALATDDVDQLTVPATPEWRVHDLVAHLRSVCEDALGGNTDGQPV